ncbi:MAG TPA: S8 family peptidase [Pyrinomonadaceae bacterium]
MPVSSRALVELVLLGPTNDRRQLQDSPVLGDVWIAYAMKPADSHDLLITPHKEHGAGRVALRIAKRLKNLRVRKEGAQNSEIAYLQGLVAARLYFEELLRVLVPMTQWWTDRKVEDTLQSYTDGKRLKVLIATLIKWAKAKNEDAQTEAAKGFAEFVGLDRFASLAAVILWAAAKNKNRRTLLGAGDALATSKGPNEIVELFLKTLNTIGSDSEANKTEVPSQIWQVSLNRRAMPAIVRSVPAVKGDAARTLFRVKCDNIRWAVLDSGIDGSHPAFKVKNPDGTETSRVVKAFDFRNIRKILTAIEMKPQAFKELLDEFGADEGKKVSLKEATRIQKALVEDAEADRPIHWELLEDYISVDPKTTKPESDHGTHVAGIIGAEAKEGSRFADGMCPDIKLYDVRVLGKTMPDTEFAIIAALQFLRYLNERHTYMTIHGANLSLSIPHDVRNFACGRTPICNESERLVESGVVVVAAAGNLGYQRFETKDGSYEGYTAFSITDPGNADGVITVGATHRYRPHTYGVSFFSSRGPTGDGRLKPDLVAPGERIESCLREHSWGELDGTSMAAPHVSGAAAMLMARYDELIGEPQRIKRILCESATDLGRERSFQGHGMLDVLRAFQSI